MKNNNADWLDSPLFWLLMAIFVLLLLAFMQYVLYWPVGTYLNRFWHIITWQMD